MSSTQQKEVKLYTLPLALSAISFIGSLISYWFVTTALSSLETPLRGACACAGVTSMPNFTPEIEQFMALWIQVGAVLLILALMSAGASLLIYVYRRDATISLPKLGGDKQ